MRRYRRTRLAAQVPERAVIMQSGRAGNQATVRRKPHAAGRATLHNRDLRIKLRLVRHLPSAQAVALPRCIRAGVHKPRGRKPRRTPRWWSGAAAMAIGLPCRRDPTASGVSSGRCRRTWIVCGEPFRLGGEQQRGIQVRSSSGACSDLPDALVGAELVDGDRA